MKPVIRYRSQLLLRRSYKPNRLLSVRPMVKGAVAFRPTRKFGLKPQIKLVS